MCQGDSGGGFPNPPFWFAIEITVVINIPQSV